MTTQESHGFRQDYTRLAEIAAELKSPKDGIADVDRIEPLVKETMVLGQRCLDRIAAVKRMIEEEQEQRPG
jgi:hypothetical protein